MNLGPESKIPYNLHKPVEKYTLPGSLEEISGVSYMEDGRIACVEDERGIIYVFNPQTGKIDHKNVFGKDGDYEDIALVGKMAYVLRYDGVLFGVQDFETGENRVEIWETALSKKNDTEGLAYDKQTHSLLITCKESPSLVNGDNYEDQEAVYRFDLQSKKLITTPHFLFDLNSAGSYKDKDAFMRLSRETGKVMAAAETDIPFHASGISIHPLTGEVYIISTKGKLLIILDRDSKVLAIQELNKKIFKQPEGICFSPSGDLYISNEGRGKKGNILKFSMH